MDDDDLRREVPALDERTRRALDVAQTWVCDDVQGIGLGETADGDACVVVYLLETGSAKPPDLPEQVEGLPVRVETGDAFSAGG